MMRPTNRLRFVEKMIPSTLYDGFRVKILQQWWEDEFHYDEATQDRAGEWREVPFEGAV